MKRSKQFMAAAVVAVLLLVAGVTLTPAAVAETHTSQTQGDKMQAENERAQDEIVTRKVMKKFRRVCTEHEQAAEEEDVTVKNEEIEMSQEENEVQVTKERVHFHKEQEEITVDKQELHLHNETIEEEVEQTQEEMKGKKGQIMRGKKAPSEDEQAAQERVRHEPHIHESEETKTITKKVPHIHEETETVSYTNPVANVVENEETHHVTVEEATKNTVCELVPLKKGKK